MKGEGRGGAEGGDPVAEARSLGRDANVVAAETASSTTWVTPEYWSPAEPLSVERGERPALVARVERPQLDGSWRDRLVPGGLRLLLEETQLRVHLQRETIARREMRNAESRLNAEIRLALLERFAKRLELLALEIARWTILRFAGIRGATQHHLLNTMR